jgi:hypothetical protein
LQEIRQRARRLACRGDVVPLRRAEIARLEFLLQAIVAADHLSFGVEVQAVEVQIKRHGLAIGRRVEPRTDARRLGGRFVFCLSRAKFISVVCHRGCRPSEAQTRGDDKSWFPRHGTHVLIIAEPPSDYQTSGLPFALFAAATIIRWSKRFSTRTRQQRAALSG